MVQTFLTSPSYNRTSQSLDRLRLGKQRSEALTIAKICIHETYRISLEELDLYESTYKRYYHHPAVLMWLGYESELIDYGLTICAEWQNRGYTDKLTWEFMLLKEYVESCDIPWWLTWSLCSNHRSILLGKAIEGVELRKAFSQQIHDWYFSLGWDETPAVKVNDSWPYEWPIRIENSGT